MNSPLREFFDDNGYLKKSELESQTLEEEAKPLSHSISNTSRHDSRSFLDLSNNERISCLSLWTTIANLRIVLFGANHSLKSKLYRVTKKIGRYRKNKIAFII